MNKELCEQNIILVTITIIGSPTEEGDWSTPEMKCELTNIRKKITQLKQATQQIIDHSVQRTSYFYFTDFVATLPFKIWGHYMNKE